RQYDRVRRRRARNREHLLLAAGECPRNRSAALLEAREKSEDALKVGGDPPSGPSIRAHHEVLADRKTVEDPPPLGHVRHTPPDDLVRRHADERISLERDRAAHGTEEA